MRLVGAERQARTCQWFDPQPDPRQDRECGLPARHKVKVIGGVTRAFVLLCEDHKTWVNNEFAARRCTERASA